jgi:hypothetical protein
MASNPYQPTPSTAVSTAETDQSMITFKSVGHFFAKAFQVIAKDIPVLENTKTVVEMATEAIPGGTAAVPLENAAYAVLGEVAAAINAGGSAVNAKLADAGLDVAVIQQVETVIKSYPNIAALAKAL